MLKSNLDKNADGGKPNLPLRGRGTAAAVEEGPRTMQCYVICPFFVLLSLITPLFSLASRASFPGGEAVFHSLSTP